MSEPSDFVFIATVGQNDVHVVLRPPEDKPRRHPLRKDSVRAFHQDCLDHKIKYHVTPLADTGQLMRRDREELEYVRDLAALVSAETASQKPQIELIQPEIELCAPLLAEAWQQIQQRIDRGELGRSMYLLLFNTRRDELDETGLPRERGEPIATGTIVQRAIMDAFGVTEDFEEYIFLREGDLYEIDAHNQRHLRADAARAIDHRIRDLRNDFPQAIALISDIAGFPETKSLLQASVAYRFNGRFEFVRPIERGRPTVQRPSLLISPAESLGIRHEIRRLIHCGSFDAAAELAMHPADDEAFDAEPWRRSVVALAHFLRSGVTPTCLGKTAKVLGALQTAPRSLVVLFRIEAKLRQGDFETAIRDTVTFAELALLELAETHLSAPGESCVNWNNAKIVLTRTREDFRQQNHSIDDRDDWFYDRRTIASWLPEHDCDAWERVFEVAKHDRVQRARNESVHARVSAAHVQSAVAKLLQKQLWTEYEDAAISILKAELPIPLFAVLGLGNVNRSYRDLIQAVRDDMDTLDAPLSLAAMHSSE